MSLNIGRTPRPSYSAKKCSVHNVFMQTEDDLINVCPVPECDRWILRDDLRRKKAPGFYAVRCTTCNWVYPSLDPEVCAICDDPMKARIYEVLKQYRGS